MRTMQRIICALLLLLPSGSLLAQDIEIRDFKQNTTSLMGSVSPVYDNTGEACSVIKFLVRDTTFVVEGNLGIMKRSSQLGEIVIHVPATTKRLTIRHEDLMPLRYELPMKLEPKKTYEAVLIALSFSPLSEEPAVRDPKQNVKNQKEVDRVTKKADTSKDSSEKPRKSALKLKKEKDSEGATHVAIGVGYQVIAISGPTISFGLDANHHQVELSGTFGLVKSDELRLYDSNNTMIATRQYTPIRLMLKYGYELMPMKNFGITPMIGGSLNVFTSPSENDSYHEYFRRASSFSLTPSVRLSYIVDEHIKVHLTPEYGLSLYKSNNCKVVSEHNNKFKKWSDGFNVSVGINYLF